MEYAIVFVIGIGLAILHFKFMPNSIDGPLSGASPDIPKYRILHNGLGDYIVQHFHNYTASKAPGVGLWLKVGEGFTTLEGAEKRIEYHKNKTRKVNFIVVKEIY